jgi:hypothetical protein
MDITDPQSDGLTGSVIDMHPAQQHVIEGNHQHLLKRSSENRLKGNDSALNYDLRWH